MLYNTWAALLVTIINSFRLLNWKFVRICLIQSKLPPLRIIPMKPCRPSKLYSTQWVLYFKYSNSNSPYKNRWYVSAQFIPTEQETVAQLFSQRVKTERPVIEADSSDNKWIIFPGAWNRYKQTTSLTDTNEIRNELRGAYDRFPDFFRMGI